MYKRQYYCKYRAKGGRGRGRLTKRAKKIHRVKKKTSTQRLQMEMETSGLESRLLKSVSSAQLIYHQQQQSQVSLSFSLSQEQGKMRVRARELACWLLDTFSAGTECL